MTPEAKKGIQLALAFAIAIAAVRAGYILYQRHQDYVAGQKQKRIKNAGYANADYYVTPKKLYPYDLKSAKQLTQQPVWVKEGYRYTYYPYNAGHVNFEQEAGTLLPIEKLQIRDVAVVQGPKVRVDAKTLAKGGTQMVAIFDKRGKDYAVPIGTENEGQWKIYSDEMFYIEDPHALYKHWPQDVWQAVEQHEVKPGMNELQADFAVGMGVPDPGDSSDDRTVRYPNGGKPLVVTYQNGKAAEVKSGT